MRPDETCLAPTFAAVPQALRRRHPFQPEPVLTLAALVLACSPALAGRPLATDDASTAQASTCQLEGWFEHGAPDRAWVLAPACGLVPGLELGAEVRLTRAPEPVAREAGPGLKLAPQAWRWATPAGAQALGLKSGATFEQQGGDRWRHASTAVAGLATLQGEGWALHANLGPQTDRALDRSATLLNLALAWTPAAPWLVIAELQANDRPSLFGNTVRTVGARWWLRPDTVGVDLTASRTAGAATTSWTLGFGWYGLGP